MKSVEPATWSGRSALPTLARATTVITPDPTRMPSQNAALEHLLHARRAGIVVLTALGFPQHADEHRPKDSILLAVDQEFCEGATLRVAPELSDPVSPLEVGEHEDVEQLGAGSRTEASRRSRIRRSS
jgi:hypothetical protein